MDNSVLGKIIRVIVTVPPKWLGALCDLIEKLASGGGDEWFAELGKFLRKEPCWPTQVKKNWKSIHPHFATILVSGSQQNFDARDAFFLWVQKSAVLVKFYSISETFLELFGNKVEKPRVERSLRCEIANKLCSNKDFLNGLEDESSVEVFLGEIFWLLTTAQKGKPTQNGNCNLFFVRDINGVLRVVVLIGSGQGWDVYVQPITSTELWPGNTQVYYPEPASA